MAKTKKNFSTRVLGALAIGLAVLLAVEYWRPANRNVPEQLIGEWQSSDERYSDRQLEITHSSISFTTGEGTVSTGFIKDVKAVPEGARTLYTVVYELEGTRNEVSFYYETGKKAEGVIRFKNQQGTGWTRKEST
jgi:hypothetical protein